MLIYDKRGSLREEEKNQNQGRTLLPTITPTSWGRLCLSVWIKVTGLVASPPTSWVPPRLPFNKLKLKPDTKKNGEKLKKCFLPFFLNSVRKTEILPFQGSGFS